MRIHSKQTQSIISSILAVAMTSSLSLTPALASAQEARVLTTGPASAGVPEWAIDDGSGTQESGLIAQAAIPSAYDLRTEGLVTPVKFQNPWGSCWAFGGTAAAETSILSAYGSTYERSKLDLSERHLTYFALQPVSASDDPTQVGEGLHTMDDSPNAAFNAGGQPIYITTLYSQGVGPMLESLFPYHGKEGITTADYYESHPEYLAEETRSQIESAASGSHMTYDQFLAYYADSVLGGVTTDEAFEYLKGVIKQAAVDSPAYSKEDDWSIPATNPDGGSNRLVSNGVVLKDGNVLPTYWVNKTDEDPSEASKNAIKQELLNGHGVTIKYYADQGGPYSAAPGASANKNTNHNQYVYAEQGQNHGVEIVGWDDAYAKENFAHGSTAEAQAVTTPKGDGAWIVKNSWGSETDATEENADDLGNVMNKGTFGNWDENNQATGYFYLSYYDRSIGQPETMEFSANLGTEGSFAVLQYDYMPASSGFYTTPASSEVTSSANVFTADDIDIAVKSISTRTAEANTRVTFAIYRLNDNAKDPTDGEILYRASRNFEYGGFHRLDLDSPISIEAGTKFSVVSTASTLETGGKRLYSASANRGLSKKAGEHLTSRGVIQKAYSTAVVNKGESYLYDGKEWKDWSEYLDVLPSDSETQAVMQSDTYTKVCPVDNFSIKVYAEPVDHSQALALEAALKAQKEAEAAQKAAEERAAAAEREADRVKASINEKDESAPAAKHTVTFDANGHGTAPATQVVVDGKAASKPSDPKVDGWTFGGWFTDKSCTEAYDFSRPVTTDMTLYAKWTQVSSKKQEEEASTDTTRATSSGTSRATSTSTSTSTLPKTGDDSCRMATVLATTGACTICLASFALHRRRKHGYADSGNRTKR